MEQNPQVFDFVIIGSGFGGSVSAMRLTEKGYSVLVMERGKRFREQDYARSNWAFWKYLWLPGLRSFGILQISPFKEVFVLHGSGVGGGSLGYANVLEVPTDELFNNPHWSYLADWKSLLLPHYETAKRMLGVTTNPRLWQADAVIQAIAAELGTLETFRPTQVGTYFGKPGMEGQEVPDPYFQGEGLPRSGCIHCGGCMVGCRHNAKNTLDKNYLYFAEKYGAQIWSECEVRDVQPLDPEVSNGARYKIVYRSSTRWLIKPERAVYGRNVIFAAGSLGTQRLLFRCREITHSMPKISQRLGENVRTNSESLLGVTSRSNKHNYSEGIAITSIVQIDEKTRIEPVRYPAGSSLMRFLSGPLVESSGGALAHLGKTLSIIFRRPADFFRSHILPGWAQRTTILLVMQTEDNHFRFRWGRDIFTLFKRNLVSLPDEHHTIPAKIDIGHQVTRKFAQMTNSIPAGTINESLMNIPMTAHILGGCPYGLNDQQGVVDLSCQIFNYPGAYVVDGSILPANPGVNPSLTITALGEYAMSHIPAKPGAIGREPTGRAEQISEQAELSLP